MHKVFRYFCCFQSRILAYHGAGCNEPGSSTMLPRLLRAPESSRQWGMGSNQGGVQIKWGVQISRGVYYRWGSNQEIIWKHKVFLHSRDSFLLVGSSGLTERPARVLDSTDPSCASSPRPSRWAARSPRTRRCKLRRPPKAPY